MAKKKSKKKNKPTSGGKAASRKEIRQEFLGWQCRIRQDSMRRLEGQPTSGMRPKVLMPDGTQLFDALTILLVPEDPVDITKQFRFFVQRSPDPRKVFEDALRLFQADHYQQPKLFSDRLTALFAAEAPAAEHLADTGECTLVFDQYSQMWEFDCRVKKLKPKSKAYKHTLWHNRLFNTQLPDGVTVLAFKPKWKSARVYYSAA